MLIITVMLPVRHDKSMSCRHMSLSVVCANLCGTCSASFSNTFLSIDSVVSGPESWVPGMTSNSSPWNRA
jgi:hypothetical protein